MYQMASFHEEALEVEPGYWTWHCDINKVMDGIDSQILYFCDTLEADKFILCLSDTSNFRKSILESYKGNRSNLKRPVVLKPTREWLISERHARVLPGLEGDDLMGILSTEEHEGERVIVSIDKDMKTIPGLFYQNEDKGMISITEQEADYWHLYQTLIGDTIDGYKGCPGVGDVGARAILDKDPTWEAVVKAYAKKGLDEEYALTQARCARILRASDFNKGTGEPILWTPTKEVDNKKEEASL
jgi:DNA polymerase-1